MDVDPPITMENIPTPKGTGMHSPTRLQDVSCQPRFPPDAAAGITLRQRGKIGDPPQVCPYIGWVSSA